MVELDMDELVVWLGSDMVGLTVGTDIAYNKLV